MEEKFNEATPQRKQDHVIDAPLVQIDIPAFAKQLKQESTWKESDRNSITVFKTDGMSIVLIALHKGAEMPRHNTDGIISVQVLEGQIKITADIKTVELSAGHMLTLHENIPHSVLAIKESLFLLTLTSAAAGK